MPDKNISVNVGRLKSIVDKWKEANVPGNNIDINKLADFTLKEIDREPLIREICNVFLVSLSVHAVKDPNFDKETYKKVENKNVTSKDDDMINKWRYLPR